MPSTHRECPDRDAWQLVRAARTWQVERNEAEIHAIRYEMKVRCGCDVPLIAVNGTVFVLGVESWNF